MKRFISGRWFALVLGSFVTAAWTLLRFFVQPIIFDAVGQQVLVHQWLQGYHSGAMTGPTNFIVKMWLVYAPLDSVPVSPYMKLIAMTLLFNVVTYMAVFWCVERILRRFAVDQKPLWLVALWTATIAGSIYWIGFANSRNLEVAGGALLLVSGLTVMRTTQWAKYALLAVFCSLLFFADPLQLYMAALPTAIFLLAESWFDRTKRENLRSILLWIGAIAAGFVGSKAWVWLCGSIWHVSFFAVPTQVSVRMLPGFGISAVKQLLQLYSGSADLGRIFLYLNPLLFIAFSIVCVVVAVRRPNSRRLMAWAAVVFGTNMAVYIASGSAAHDTNSRYLIMTLPAIMVAFSAVLAYAPKSLRYAMYAVLGGVTAFGIVLLTGALVAHADVSFAQDRHYAAVDAYMHVHDYPYAYASMNTALPTTYLYGNGKLLPLGCLPAQKLQTANLFFDSAYTRKLQRSPTSQIPLILDPGSSITNVPAVCDEAAIIQQFGAPIRSERLSDGSRALIYNALTLRQQAAFLLR